MTDPSADLTDQFIIDCAGVADRRGCSRVDLVGVMESESQIHARAHNPSGATGEIQFDNWTKDHKQIVLPGNIKVTWQELAAMTDDDQLKYVETYLTAFKGRLGVPGQVYTACFLPAAAMNPHYSLDFVVCGSRDGDPLQWAYHDNPLFDTAHKGYITGADMAQRTNWAANLPRAQAVLARMATLCPSIS